MTRRGRVILLAIFCFAAGCSSGPAMAPVSGTVTYKGQPLENAIVVFIPVEPDVLPASGLTDAKGRYQLLTKVPGDGVRLGKHRVTITARAPDRASKGEIGMPTEPAALLIPRKYTMPDTSGLVAEVRSGGSTSTDFALTADRP